MEELRSEMLEMRDMYMEDDVYQLQELRQQLEQVRLLAHTPIAVSQGFRWFHLRHKHHESLYVVIQC